MCWQNPQFLPLMKVKIFVVPRVPMGQRTQSTQSTHSALWVLRVPRGKRQSTQAAHVTKSTHWQQTVDLINHFHQFEDQTTPLKHIVWPKTCRSQTCQTTFRLDQFHIDVIGWTAAYILLLECSSQKHSRFRLEIINQTDTAKDLALCQFSRFSTFAFFLKKVC